MTDTLFTLLKGLMVFGLPLAWGVRELVLLRRDRATRDPGPSLLPERHKQPVRDPA